MWRSQVQSQPREPKSDLALSNLKSDIKSTVNSCPQLLSLHIIIHSRDRMSMLATLILNHNASTTAYHFLISYPTLKTCQSIKTSFRQVLDQNKIATCPLLSNENNSPFINSSLNLLIHPSQNIPLPLTSIGLIALFGFSPHFSFYWLSGHTYIFATQKYQKSSFWKYWIQPSWKSEL